MDDISEIDRLAAWIDSDGTIGIRKSKPDRRAIHPIYHPQVGVYNTSPAVMQWLQTTFGGTVSPRKKLRSAAHRRELVWHCSSALRTDILKRIIPYLLVKQDRAALVIDYDEGMLWDGRARKGRGRATQMPDDEVNRREGLYQKSHRLNQLGPPNAA